MRIHSLRHTFISTLFALVSAFAQPAHASIDYTDIWWAGVAESGWGVNLSQSGNFIFATFFIYDANGVPTWYTAELSRTTGETFSGPVVRSSGTAANWFGSPAFTPGSISRAQVGTATFTATSAATATLAYSVSGVNVNKTISRQTTLPQSLVTDVANGGDLYAGGLYTTYTGTCPSGTAPGVTPLYFSVQMSTTTPPTIVFYTTTTNGLAPFCAMQGNLVQQGKVFSATGAKYQCGTGLMTNGTSEIDSVRLLDNGIELHWHANVPSTTSPCLETGRVSGVRVPQS